MRTFRMCSTVAVLLAVAPATAGPPEDDTITPEKITREQFERVKKMMGSRDHQVAPSKGPLKTEIDREPAPVDLAPEAVDRIVDQLAKSFFFGFHLRDSLKFEGDVFFVPNLAQVALTVEWKTVLGEGRQGNLLRPPTEQEREKDKRSRSEELSKMGDDYRYSAEVRLTTDDSDMMLTRAEGEGVLRLPTEFARWKFACGEVGKVQKGEGIEVRLERCERDFVEISRRGARGEFIVILRNAAGARLDITEMESFPLFKGGKTVVQLDYSDLPIKPEAQRERYLAKGEVKTIELALAKTFTERKFAALATPEPSPLRAPPIAPTVVRYLPEAGEALFVDLSSSELRRETRLQATRSYAAFGFNTPELKVILPRGDNSAYASIDFGEPKLIDGRGAPVAYELERGGESEIRFTNPNGRESIQFARVKGSVHIRYPAKVRTIRLTPKQPEKDGVAAVFAGGKVELVLPENLAQVSFPPEYLRPLRGYLEGRRVRQLSDFSSIGDRQSFYFWGTIDELRLNVVDRWEELDLLINLPPAPPLPESRRGVAE